MAWADLPESSECSAHASRELSYRLCQEYYTIIEVYELDQYLKPATLRLVKTQNQMGSWHPAHRMISINMNLLIHYTWQEVVEVLKHEIAHQLQWEHLGFDPDGLDAVHGELFQQACAMIAVAPWARGPRAHLHPKSPTLEELCSDTQSPWEVKIKKLLSLSQSSNEHEARLAMAKARELSEKNHRWCLNRLESYSDIHCHSLSLNTKRRTAMHIFLAQVLSEMFAVRPVFNYEWSMTKRCDVLVLDLVGHPKDLLMAEHMFHYLNATFARLWRQRKQHHQAAAAAPASMRIAKRSYYQGLMNGFVQSIRMRDGRTPTPPQDVAVSDHAGWLAKTTALSAQHQQKIKDFLRAKYPKSSTQNRRTRYRVDLQEIKAGEQHGVNISIAKPIAHAEPRMLHPK